MADMNHPDDADSVSLMALLQNAPRLMPSTDLWQRIAANAALAPVLVASQVQPVVSEKHAHDVTHEVPWHERGFALAASLVFAAALVALPWLTATPEQDVALAVSDTSVTLPFDDDTADEALAWLAGLGDNAELTDVAPEIRTIASLGNLGLNTLVYAQE